MTQDAPQPPQRIEFANGVTLEIPAVDPTLRTDVWVDAFDGTYRFWLPLLQAQELETKCGFIDDHGARRPRGLLAIYGAIARGRYELEGRSVGFAVEGAATIAECRETVRLALIGGGVAVVDDALVKIDASRARQLVDAYLTPAAVEHSWDLAYLILHTAIHGRKQRPEEEGTTSKSAVPPLNATSGSEVSAAEGLAVDPPIEQAP